MGFFDISREEQKEATARDRALQDFMAKAVYGGFEKEKKFQRDLALIKAKKKEKSSKDKAMERKDRAKTVRSYLDDAGKMGFKVQKDEMDSLNKYIETGEESLIQGSYSNLGKKVHERNTKDLREKVSTLTETKNFNEVITAYRKVKSNLKNPTAAGDLGMIFNIMKTFDPGSVVREGEFATAQNSAGVPDRIRNFYNRVISGERLNPVQRKDFATVAYEQALAQQKGYDEVIRPYRESARQMQVNPASVFPVRKIEPPKFDGDDSKYKGAVKEGKAYTKSAIQKGKDYAKDIGFHAQAGAEKAGQGVMEYLIPGYKRKPVKSGTQRGKEYRAKEKKRSAEIRRKEQRYKQLYLKKMRYEKSKARGK